MSKLLSHSCAFLQRQLTQQSDRKLCNDSEVSSTWRDQSREEPMRRSCEKMVLPYWSTHLNTSSMNASRPASQQQWA